MLNGDSNSFFTERLFHEFNHQTHGLISDVQNGWWMVGGWLVDGLSNIFGKHRHPGWQSLLNNQWNGMTDGF